MLDMTHLQSLYIKYGRNWPSKFVRQSVNILSPSDSVTDNAWSLFSSRLPLPLNTSCALHLSTSEQITGLAATNPPYSCPRHPTRDKVDTGQSRKAARHLALFIRRH